MKWKGNNLYTILPVRSAVDTFHRQQLRQLELDTECYRTLQRQAEYDRRHPRVAPCATAVAEATPWPIPTVQAAVRPLNASVQGDDKEQDKGRWSLTRPPASHTAPQRGSGIFHRWSVLPPVGCPRWSE